MGQEAASHVESEASAEPPAGAALPAAAGNLNAVSTVLALQRSAGNRAVANLVARRPHSRQPHARRWSSANPIGTPHPARAPMATELLADPVVVAAMHQAWVETRADEPGRPHALEQGGWIYMDLGTGTLSVQRGQPHSLADRSGTYRINLGSPPVVPGSVLVGRFHTHPSGSPHSEIDTDLAGGSAVPEFVVRGDGVIDTYGLPVRGGDWSHAAAEPLFPR